jgi:hypothetical protein
VLGFDFQFLFAGFADPVVFAVDEGVVVDALAVVFCTDVTLHIVNVRLVVLLTAAPSYEVMLSHLWFLFLGSGAKHD